MAAPALDFERPLLDLEQKLAELKRLAAGSREGSTFEPEIRRLEKKARRLQQEIFQDLSRWQVVQLSRHPRRPYTLDYLGHLFTDYLELRGDRAFGDDQSIVGGLARLDGEPVLVLGHQKGRNTKEHVRRNFGMPRPEGYRKAKRLMELAARFARPIVTFIDTPGAFPGIEAEARGQAQAIADCLETMARLPVPIVAVVIGEGGSGGALAIGVANRLLMLEYATYSVISPESCSAILYRDNAHAERAADAMRMTARDAAALGVADEVVAEAPGGAHRDHAATAEKVGAAVRRHLAELVRLSPTALVEDRYRKFRALGVFHAAAPSDTPENPS